MSNIHQELSTRPTYLEIDCKKLRHNFDEIKKQISKKKLMCIVKGNAYGHGIIEIAKQFEKFGADYLGVAIPEEGVEIRRAGVTAPILVLAAISDTQIPVCLEYDLTITAPSAEKLQQINHIAKQQEKTAKVHIKVDTGMGRIGVHWQRIEKFIPVMNQCTHINFEGLFAHFACTDEVSDFTNIQIERFDEVVSKFSEAGFIFPLIHHANSGGALFHAKSHYSMVRAGIALYGLFEGRDIPDHISLQPVMSWHTEVVYFKYLASGTGIGYGHTFTTEQGTRIVTLPVGYADGYMRSMGIHGNVIINDQIVPICGRVCMDQMMVNIGPEGTAYSGDKVFLVGSSDNHSITFYDIAIQSGMSIYELLSQISYRVPRMYINE